jgi:hypothetical protein
MRAGAAILALLVAAAAPPAMADPRSEAMLRELVQSIDASPEWSATVAAIRTNEDNTIVEGLAVSRQDPPLSLSVGEILLTDLQPGTDGGFSAAYLEISELIARVESTCRRPRGPERAPPQPRTWLSNMRYPPPWSRASPFPARRR